MYSLYIYTHQTVKDIFYYSDAFFNNLTIFFLYCEVSIKNIHTTINTVFNNIKLDNNKIIKYYALNFDGAKIIGLVNLSKSNLFNYFIIKLYLHNLSK